MNLISRRTFTQGVVGATVVCALPSWSMPRKSKTTPRPLEISQLTLATSGKAALYHLPLVLADCLGYFKAEGLQLQIVDYAGGERALQAVLDGQAQVVSGAYENTIYLQAQKQMFQAFVLQAQAPQIVLGACKAALPAYQSITDLAGKKVGVSALGSSGHLVAHWVLARAGVSDVSFVALGSAADALLAVRSGLIDAISYSEPLVSLLEQSDAITLVADTRSLRGTVEVFGSALPTACLYASLEFVKNNPNTCQALANGVVHALKWLHTASPNDIMKNVPESYWLGDRALYLATLSKLRGATSPDGLITASSLKTVLRAVSGLYLSIRPESIDLAQTYTNEFSKRALKLT